MRIRPAPSVQAASPTRRSLLALLAIAAAAGGCRSMAAPDDLPALRALLAPAGSLRVAVYLGSPSSLVRGSDGRSRGVAVELGQDLARRLQVPYQQVEFARVAEVIDSLREGRTDFTITNATPARAALVELLPPLLSLELGYLALPGSPVSSIDEVDRPGVRIGVSLGSTSQATLGRQMKAATVVPVPSLQAGAQMLAQRRLDVFATNKAVLSEMADGLPGARVLPGNWGLEHLAIAIPKGRDAGLDFLRRFSQQARDDGLVKAAAGRAGLRGIAP